MSSPVTCATLIGNESVIVEVESHLLGNLKKFTIVGLPDSQLRESKERVRCAIGNSGLPFPDDELVVNLGPASVPKSGVGFDLAIALSILNTCGYVPDSSVQKRLFLGELSLDGTLRPPAGVLHAACLVKKLGLKEIWVPRESTDEALLLDGVDVVPVSSLKEVISMLRGHKEINPVRGGTVNTTEEEVSESLSDVCGQYATKRALEIVAAGGHNLLMVGPPGVGKTMLAKRLSSIMPPLERDEMVELTCLRALGKEKINLCTSRPFRSPHHTVSGVALVGGGTNPRPGEISLAHKGVLFLDELAEFKKSALDCLRQPLEEQCITVTRAKSSANFPADFTLVAAMNPPDMVSGLQRQLEKVSKPFLDRIDLQVWVSPPTVRDLEAKKATDRTREIKERVERAREAQTVRGKLNSRLSAKDLSELVEMEPDGKELLNTATDRKRLSARARAKTIKVARTVADLEQSHYVGAAHIAEALSYRIND